jgi:integrase
MSVGSVRSRPETGKLFFDFRFQGHRCREHTLLDDTPPNRKKMQAVLTRIEAEIKLGQFRYERTFPSSVMLAKFDVSHPTGPQVQHGASHFAPASTDVSRAEMEAAETLTDFAETWFRESSVQWRKSHQIGVRSALDKHILPHFSGRKVGEIFKADVLDFRVCLAECRGRSCGSKLSPRRINAIVGTLRTLMSEASERLNFVNTTKTIKPLKERKRDVEPFSLAEVRRVLDAVRPDYRNYYIVRFFTGMRTGEIDGLKWKYVDLENRIIRVRETVVNGDEEYTKTEGSQRDINMSSTVHAALLAQREGTGSFEYVFCTRNGKPLCHRNVTQRVWYPLLRTLQLNPRRPYETRHTAATLWLAAGENPNWIASQLGHTSTEMLFRVYARFVPNVTRQDGSAMERLLNAVAPENVKVC